jgi:hypothetical protein
MRLGSWNAEKQEKNPGNKLPQPPKAPQGKKTDLPAPQRPSERKKDLNSRRKQ